jgi:hypothetical protein
MGKDKISISSKITKCENKQSRIMKITITPINIYGIIGNKETKSKRAQKV